MGKADLRGQEEESRDAPTLLTTKKYLNVFK